MMRSWPVREIHEIEFSSRCSLACVYCPHPNLQRAKADMGMDVFERTLAHLEYYCRLGTQGEVSLTGIGEAILHPEFVPMMWRVRLVIGPDRKLILSTNGIDITQELCDELAQADVGVYVSMHRPEIAAKAYAMLRESGVYTGHNHAFVDSALDWAGQVDWHVSVPKRAVCGYLTNSWAVVRQDGAVDACCMDAHNLYQQAHVNDRLGSWRTAPTGLCASCNFMVPVQPKSEVASV